VVERGCDREAEWIVVCVVLVGAGDVFLASGGVGFCESGVVDRGAVVWFCVVGVGGAVYCGWGAGHLPEVVFRDFDLSTGCADLAFDFMETIASRLIAASRLLADELRPLVFSGPVSHSYLTIDYAREGYEGYLKKFGDSSKRVLFLGMNPGPYGMAQTGVPFGEVAMVRDWMGLNPKIGRPANEHTKRRISGMECEKSEVSGRRLWGLFSQRFPKAEDFFAGHLAINFCPLIWMKDTGANLTPDKIRAGEMEAVDAACQRHLQTMIRILEPVFLIGVGGYAERQMMVAGEKVGVGSKIGKILHPSPASPAANRGWAEVAQRQLEELGVW
jgi:single-strand selective monofunctional uracil DNA glycosylase